MLRCVLAATLALGVGACLVPNPNATDDDSSTTGTDSDEGAETGAETETDGEPTCSAQTSQCVATAPEGWNGPVVLARDVPGGLLPECLAPYPEVAWEELFEGFVPGNHECDCACGDADPAPSCAEPVLKKHDAAANCVSMSFDEPLLADECVELGADLGWDGRFRFSDPGVVDSACPTMPLHVIDEPSFAEALVVCGGAELNEGCEMGERCAPKPPAGFESLSCIWQEGDKECPAGSGYPEQHVVFQGSQMDRTCSECACGEPTSTCVGTVDIISGSCDPGVLLGSISADECSDNFAEAKHARWNPVTEGDGGCVPSESQPSGGVAAVGAVTICCP